MRIAKSSFFELEGEDPLAQPHDHETFQLALAGFLNAGSDPAHHRIAEVWPANWLIETL